MGRAVGFTGTRKGMAMRQKAVCYQLMSGMGMSSFHHGDCVGADEEAAVYAMVMGGVETHSHPPWARKVRAFTTGNTVVHKPAPYLERNREIVDMTTVLIACPDGMGERTRSGTWYTVRYARAADKQIAIVWPNGTVTREGEWHG